METTTQETDELSTYSFDELLQLNRRLQTEIRSRQARELESHREKTYELASTLGISIEQMFNIGHKPARKPQSTGNGKPPKEVYYQDPANPENVGARKGPPAPWLKAYLDQGRNKEEFIAKK